MDAGTVKSDIELFMRYTLRSIPLTDSQWVALLEQCGVLFIYASSTCRFIMGEYDSGVLDEAIHHITHSSRVENPNIDGMYAMILSAAFAYPRVSQTDRRRMRKILETVAYTREAITLDEITSLLGLSSPKQAGLLLQPLRSVLNFTKATELVTPLHNSFRDFLASPNRAGDFYCVGATQHAALAKSYLQRIEALGSKFNMCGLPTSYLCDNEVENIDPLVSYAISPELIHACWRWSSHLYFSVYQDELAGIVRNFFSKRLLLWMEILNLSKSIHRGRDIIREVEMWCSVSRG